MARPFGAEPFNLNPPPSIRLDSSSFPLVPTGQGMITPFEAIVAYRPPKYEGDDDPTVIESWITILDRMFHLTQCPDEDKLGIATLYLKNEAAIWWETVKESRVFDSTFGWRHFVALLRTRFYPPSLLLSKLKELKDFKQGILGVEEYYYQFSDLSRFAPVSVDAKHEEISRFKSGLNRSIRAALVPFEDEVTTLQGWYKKAVEIDKGFKQERGACPKCGRNHWTTDCSGEPITCFKCGGLGHRANQCPHPRQLKRKRPNGRPVGAEGYWLRSHPGSRLTR